MHIFNYCFEKIIFHKLAVKKILINFEEVKQIAYMFTDLIFVVAKNGQIYKLIIEQNSEFLLIFKNY